MSTRLGSPRRWAVAVVDDHAPSRADLRAAVEAAGGAIAGEAVRAADALPLVRGLGADIAVFAVGLPDRDGVEAAADVIAHAQVPVVLFTSHTGPELVARARAAGVMAFLLKPLRRAELAPALDLAIARFEDARELRRRLEERKLIERAKGTLMARLGLTEDEAFRRLRRAAMDSRRPMAEIARRLLASESAVPALPAK